MDFAALQDVMARTYGDRDAARGVPASIAWLCEEVGEFARASRKGTPQEQLDELSDVLAWLASIANQLGLSMEDAVNRYAGGCPKCSTLPCRCAADAPARSGDDQLHEAGK